MGKERITVPLGNYITLISRKNKNLQVTRLVGVGADKEIIISLASDYETNLKICQIIEAGDFVVRLFDFEKTRKLAIARYDWEGPSIVSSQYHVFRITNSLLLGEYLFLLFNKAVFEKWFLYMCFGGIRGALSYKSFCLLPISIPSVEIQQWIINRYQTIDKYLKTKKNINELLEKYMKLYFHLLINNKEGCIIQSFEEIFRVIRGGRPPRWNKELDQKYFCKEGGIPWLQVRDVTKKEFKFVDETLEQLTEEGFKKGNCEKIFPKDLIFVQNTSSFSNLGKIYVNMHQNLTINTNFWAFSNNSAGGGAPMSTYL